MTSTVQSIKSFSEPLVAQHRGVLETLDGIACKGLDHSLNAIHHTAKAVNGTRTSVEAGVASARSSADAHLAMLESTALALAAPVIVSSVNAVDDAIERFIPASPVDAAASTEDQEGEDAGEQAPEYQFATLPESPKVAPSALPKYNEDEAEANAAAAAASPPAATPFGTETKKLLKQIEAVCTKAQFRARARALVQVQHASARTEAVVAQLKANTVDLLAYAKKIGADGYGYVTSEEAAADVKEVAAKASAVAADVAGSAAAKAEEVVPAPVVDQAKRIAEMLTAYYATGLDLAKQHEVAERVTTAAAVFYGHVERLTRGPHRDQVLAFLLRRTEADAAAAPGAAGADGGSPPSVELQDLASASLDDGAEETEAEVVTEDVEAAADSQVAVAAEEGGATVAATNAAGSVEM